MFFFSFFRFTDLLRSQCNSRCKRNSKTSKWQHASYSLKPYESHHSSVQKCSLLSTENQACHTELKQNSSHRWKAAIVMKRAFASSSLGEYGRYAGSPDQTATKVSRLGGGQVGEHGTATFDPQTTSNMSPYISANVKFEPTPGSSKEIVSQQQQGPVRGQLKRAGPYLLGKSN